MGNTITTITTDWLLPDFIIVGRQLLEELLDAIFLPHRVNIRNLVVWQGGEVEVNLEYNIVLIHHRFHINHKSFVTILMLPGTMPLLL